MSTMCYPAVSSVLLLALSRQLRANHPLELRRRMITPQQRATHPTIYTLITLAIRAMVNFDTVHYTWCRKNQIQAAPCR